MAYQFRNLVFEGGGVKGIAYVGALEILQKEGILPQIQRVGGTSAGAINATLFALGYSNQETRTILKKLDFNNFLDDSWGIIRDTDRLINKFGPVARRSCPEPRQAVRCHSLCGHRPDSCS